MSLINFIKSLFEDDRPRYTYTTTQQSSYDEPPHDEFYYNYWTMEATEFGYWRPGQYEEFWFKWHRRNPGKACPYIPSLDNQTLGRSKTAEAWKQWNLTFFGIPAEQAVKEFKTYEQQIEAVKEWQAAREASKKPQEPPKQEQRTNYQPEAQKPTKGHTAPATQPIRQPQPETIQQRASPEPLKNKAAAHDTDMTPIHDTEKNKGGRPALFSDPEYLAASPNRRRQMQTAFYVDQGKVAIDQLAPELRGSFFDREGKPYSKTLLEQVGRALTNETQERCDALIKRAARQLRQGKTVKEVENSLRHSRTNRRN